MCPSSSSNCNRKGLTCPQNSRAQMNRSNSCESDPMSEIPEMCKNLIPSPCPRPTARSLTKRSQMKSKQNACDKSSEKSKKPCRVSQVPPKGPESSGCQSPAPPRLPRKKLSKKPMKSSIIPQQKPKCILPKKVPKRKENKCEEQKQKQPCGSTCNDESACNNENNQCEAQQQNQCDSTCPPPCPDDLSPKKSNCAPPVSKKFLKMKYEIEQQNYIIEKVNREIEMKTSKNFPTTELERLHNVMRQERTKLMKMIRFAMSMQKELETDVWGPITISSAYEQLENCRREKKKCVRPPVTPSDTSKVSGFDELEVLLISDSADECKKDIEEKEELICELQEQLNEAEEENKKIMEKCLEDEAKREECLLKKSSALELFKQLDEVKDLNDELACNLQNIKENVKQLRDEIATVK